MSSRDRNEAMIKRILLSAIIGAGFAGIFYPAPHLVTKMVASAVAFFVLLGILFCTIGSADRSERPPESDPSRSLEERKTAGL